MTTTATVQQEALSEQLLTFWRTYAEMLEVMEAQCKDQPAWAPIIAKWRAIWTGVGNTHVTNRPDGRYVEPFSEFVRPKGMT